LFTISDKPNQKGCKLKHELELRLKPKLKRGNLVQAQGKAQV